MLEVKSMFLSGFLDVIGCLKFFRGVFSVVFAWEKSMLSRWMFRLVVSPDYGHYYFGNVDGVGCLG